MPKYLVHLVGMSPVEGTIEVEADDEEEAIRIAEYTGEDTDWTLSTEYGEVFDMTAVGTEGPY